MESKVLPMNNGDWKLNSISPALVISSGQVYLGERKPRGLTLDVVLEMIRKNPEERYYYKIVPRVVTLGEALASDKFETLGETRDTYAAVDLILLRPERDFESLPKTGKELLENKYKSKPKEI